MTSAQNQKVNVYEIALLYKHTTDIVDTYVQVSTDCYLYSPTKKTAEKDGEKYLQELYENILLDYSYFHNRFFLRVKKNPLFQNAYISGYGICDESGYRQSTETNIKRILRNAGKVKNPQDPETSEPFLPVYWSVRLIQQAGEI